MAEYVIKDGDTLTSIARQFGLDGYDEIVKVNRIKNPNKIKAGRTLVIPGKAEPDPVPNPRPRPNVTKAVPNPRPRPNVTKAASRPEGPARGMPPAKPKPVTGRGPDTRGEVPKPPAANRTARSDLTPEQLDRVRQRQGIGPYSSRPETPGRMPGAAETTNAGIDAAYSDRSRVFDDPPPLSRMADSVKPPAPAADNTPPIGNLSEDSFPPSLDIDGMIQQVLSLMPGMADARFPEQVSGADTRGEVPKPPAANRTARQVLSLMPGMADARFPEQVSGAEGGDLRGQAAGDPLDPYATFSDIVEDDPYAAFSDPVDSEWDGDLSGIDVDALRHDEPPSDAPVKYATPIGPEANNPYDTMSEEEAWRHRIQLGSQAALRGLGADLPGAAYDLPNAIFMATQWLANKGHQGGVNLLNLFREEPEPVPEDVTPRGLDQAAAEALQSLGVDVEMPEQPFNLSDFIAGHAANAATAAGVPPLDEDDMSRTDRFMYGPLRFASGATGGGGVLSQAAHTSLAPRVAAQQPKRFGDVFMKPYVEEPGKAVARDAFAGFGAGTGANVAPENPIAQILAILGGAIGGSATFGAGLNTVRGISKLVGKAKSNPARVYDPETGEVPPDSAINRAMAVVQYYIRDANRPRPGVPANPNIAADVGDRLAARADEFRREGLPMPTSDQLAQDVGLSMLGSATRNKNSGPFVANDNRLREAAAGKISSLRDPNANLDAVKTSIDASERAYEMAREAEAMPLLRQAEASGAVVDASPVVAMIDRMLMKDKRPAVRKALLDAKKLLKPAEQKADQTMMDIVDSALGPSASRETEWDTTVSGLYETRKAIADLIKGRGEDSTGRWAQTELIAIQKALDDQINAAAPEFGQYLQKFREGSAPLDDYKKGTLADSIRNATDFRNVAKRMLDEPWGGAESVKALKQLTRGDPEAGAALRAAFADELSRRVTTTNKAATGDYEASYAALARMFKEKEDMLADVFDQPGQMHTLRQGHKLLEVLRDAARSASAGSNTAQKMGAMATFVERIQRPMEVALKARYGVLKGGGIARTVNLALQMLPDGEDKVQRLIERAFFDPELMTYLLKGKLPNMSAGASNKYVRSLLTGYVAGNTGDDEKSVASDVEK
jgi:LysM repeat protein